MTDGTGKGAHYFPEGHKLHGSFHDPDDPDAGGDTVVQNITAEKHFKPKKEKHERVAQDAIDLPDVRRWMADTHFEKKRMPKGIDPTIRKIWFPELFKEKYPIELIRTKYREQPPPIEVEQAMHEIIPYHHDRMHFPGKPWDGDSPPKYVLCLHPAYPGYWALFELVRSNGTIGYKCFSIGQEEPVEGKLPPGLDEKRWRHLTGKVGARRMFTREDFELLRYYADRHLGVDTIDERLSEEDVEKEKAVDAYHADLMDDFHDYYFRAVQYAANDGKKQWLHVTSFEDIQKQNADRKYATFVREGYKVRVRRGSQAERELRAEDEAARAAVEKKAEAVEPNHEQEKERRNAELILKRAQAIQLGRTDLLQKIQSIQRKKTM